MALLCPPSRLVLSFVSCYVRFSRFSFVFVFARTRDGRPRTCAVAHQGENLELNDKDLIIRCAHRHFSSDPHRPRRRHHRHLAALPLPPRRPDAERGDQPPRPRHGRDRARDSRIVIRSLDTNASLEAEDWHELRDRRELRLLSLLAHFFEVRGLTLTTSSESPAGAGIAGSSALNVAVCAALAEWNRTHYEPEALLQIAMNIEAQAINVPTGLQDYRPAMYGGIAALELDPDASAACRCTWTSTSCSGASSSATRASRAIPAPTTGRSRRSTSTATATCSTASSASATRRPPCGKRWSAETGNEVGQTIAEEWDNRKRLAPGVTTPAIEDLIARAMACGGDGGQGVRRRRRRMPVRLWPARDEGRHRRGPRRRRRAAARLSDRAARADAWITGRLARVFGEIADLLEIKGANAFKIRAYRSAAETIAAWPDPVARMDDAQLRDLPGIGKDLAAKIRELARHRLLRVSPGAAPGISSDDPRPAAAARCRAEDGGPALQRAEHPLD